jgi:hypothetical protein
MGPSRLVLMRRLLRSNTLSMAPSPINSFKPDAQWLRIRAAPAPCLGIPLGNNLAASHVRTHGYRSAARISVSVSCRDGTDRDH